MGAWPWAWDLNRQSSSEVINDQTLLRRGSCWTRCLHLTLLLYIPTAPDTTDILSPHSVTRRSPRMSDVAAPGLSVAVHVRCIHALAPRIPDTQCHTQCHSDKHWICWCSMKCHRGQPRAQPTPEEHSAAVPEVAAICASVWAGAPSPPLHLTVQAAPPSKRYHPRTRAHTARAHAGGAWPLRLHRLHSRGLP